MPRCTRAPFLCPPPSPAQGAGRTRLGRLRRLGRLEQLERLGRLERLERPGRSGRHLGLGHSGVVEAVVGVAVHQDHGGVHPRNLVRVLREPGVIQQKVAVGRGGAHLRGQDTGAAVGQTDRRGPATLARPS